MVVSGTTSAGCQISCHASFHTHSRSHACNLFLSENKDPNSELLSHVTTSHQQGDSGGPVLVALDGSSDNWVAGVQIGLTRREEPPAHQRPRALR